MKISVVVLTFKRNEMLKICLDSLFAGQPKLPDELVIVNAGGSSIDTIVEPHKGRGVDIKIVPTDNRSVTYNRNTGIRSSTGDLVAFTDDDCIVGPEWIKKYTETFSGDPQIGSVGGRINDISSGRLTHGLQDMLMRISEYFDRINNPFCYYFQTANVCYSRKALESIGMFDEDFKRTSGEDLRVGIKLLLAGYKNIYRSDIWIQHHGRGLKQLLRRLFTYGSDLNAAMKGFRGTRFEHLYNMRRPSIYFIVSILTGAVTDAIRFRNEMNAFTAFFYSFIIKYNVNAGILYERWFKR